ncbi:MAG TPA: hypothetical protein DCW90_23455 [Lachnospiraceae bacterium]|nr:hypothetical protein [Lachnospiraceae bacterium]
MVVYRCDFCGKVFRNSLHAIYFGQDLFDKCYHNQIREHIGMPCTMTFQGEDVFEFQICSDCFKDISHIVLNCVGIDKKIDMNSGERR